MNTALLLSTLMMGAPPSPPSAFAQALYVKVNAPEGVRATWRPGTGNARIVDGPVGLRPGYIHRLRLDGFVDEPKMAFDIAIEVRESLFMPVTLKPFDYPATLPISADDLKRVMAGGMMTKVIYLEDPMTAMPEATQADRPIERDTPRGESPLEEARKRGRPLAIVRMGSRELTPEELQAFDVPGAMHYLGEPLVPPAYPPMIPSRTYGWWDPAAGPKIPTEELLPDGGDIGPRVGIGANGHLGNVDVTDTAVEYRADGKAKATTSNRVCLFAPRFLIIRDELAPSSYITTQPTALAAQAAAPGINRLSVPPKLTKQSVSMAATRTREQPRAAFAVTGLHELDSYRGGPLVVGTVEGVRVKATVVEPMTMTQYRDQCKPNDSLVLIKTLDPREAQPGDVVTFTIKVANYGKYAATNVIVVDSLSPRLDYVSGSSRGDRPTVFTMQANEAGSNILRWEVTGEIPPGQSGVVQFQAKVR